MDFYNSIYENKYAAYQAAKWYQKNLKNSPKTVEKLTQDIAKFEDDLQEEHQKMLNKCPHCKKQNANFFTQHSRMYKMWTCKS